MAENEVTGTADKSAFPSAAEMDLDMLRAGPVRARHITAAWCRTIDGVADQEFCVVYGNGENDLDRDRFSRRIEMMGDLYEALRRAAEKMEAAGLNASEENEVLSNFVTPKGYEL